MSDALLHMAIGPVQSFIAAARRSRDLWFGSFVLSEVAKAAARVARDWQDGKGATLLFPSPEVPLEPSDGPVVDGEPVTPAPNKLLVRVTGGDVGDLAQQMADAAHAEFARAAGKVQQSCADLIRDDAAQVWEEQVSTLLQIDWAFSAYDGTGKSRAAIEAAVEEAKTLRPFRAIKHHLEGAFKSAFDGAGDSVLVRRPKAMRSISPREQQALARFQQYRIDAREGLDAIGLLKRAGGRPEQFVPLTNVALAHWLDRLPAGLMSAVDRECRALRVLSRVVRPDLRCGQVFTFDAQIFLDDRLPHIAREYDLSDDQMKPLKDAIRAARKALREPVPYVACLVGDGDRLGAHLKSRSLDELPAISKALAEFSQAALAIVAQESGLPIYAGGDDVLAFLPLNTALTCARRLRDEYMRRVSTVHFGGEATFSVGIGIGHVLDSMGDLLELGREAEQLAKGDDLDEDDQRDALALVMEKRGGQRRVWRRQWKDDAAARVEAARERLHARTLPVGKLFELDTLLTRLPDVSADDLARYAQGILRRAEPGAGEDRPGGLSLADVKLEPCNHQTLRAFVELHVIARLLVAAIAEEK